MSWDVKAGDRVVCVDDSEVFDGSFVPKKMLVRGSVYVVRRVDVWSGWTSRDAGVGVWLEGVARKLDKKGREHPFGLQRFRPVRITSIEALKAHLNVIPACKSEEA